MFENPKRLEEASSSGVWQPVLKDNGEPESGGAPAPAGGCIPEEGGSSAIVADESKESDIQISPAEVRDDLKAPSPAVGGEDAPAGVGSPSAKKEPPGASNGAGGGENVPTCVGSPSADAEQPGASKQDPDEIATAEKRLSDLKSQLDQVSQYGGCRRRWKCCPLPS